MSMRGHRPTHIPRTAVAVKQPFNLAVSAIPIAIATLVAWLLLRA
jgi:hypothetical protein